ncbi:hypothetical protein GGI17_002442 [Coemansia sp. S146]|nr:hypothetical protein GGI17_002442 [Coemansia sp. S146]
MRTISLSSRLQWAFRGTVLPGALATGDVDNDGCKEFVVGSVQGELAIFRGRGGCGSWRFSEDQIEPEYDCWDAIDRGEIPTDHPAPGSEPASLRRQGTYNSLMQGLSSNHESLSVSDILHMFEGGDQTLTSQTGSANSSEDETDGARRESGASQWDSENPGHVKWEDALDIERDGRKPWIVAQKLGTISSVVVADICNCGHNSIVVVNGEGKCHIFDYPFKRRFHPDIAKRRRQHNHYRRFSQDRFFKDGVVTDINDQSEDQPSSRQPGQSCSSGRPLSRDIGGGDGAPLQADISTGDSKQSSSPHTKFAVFDNPASSTNLGNNRRRGHSNSVSTPAIHKREAVTAEVLHTSGPANASMLPRMAASTAQLASGPGYADMSRSYASGPNSHAYISNTARRSVSGVGGHPHESDNQEAALASGSDMALTSNLSSQRDPPLTILDKCEGREHRESAYRDTRRNSEIGRSPVSPAAIRAHAGAGQRGFSADTGGSGSRRHPNTSDAGADSLSAAYGDADIDSDVDFPDTMSDNGDIPLLSREEADDIENIWGANLGKKSGDWFPYVLDRPDMTFAIPTNVEHAIVADVDNNGLNELVLTATDGFVYIFRIESTVKHAVKPTLSSLGVFSTIPTTLPSVNMTGNGSPYLHMSAPRSPDASDLDLNDFQMSARPLGGSRANRKKSLGTQAGHSSKVLKHATTTAPNSAIPGVESDLDLVNNLFKSIKDISLTPVDRKAESAVVGEVRVFPQLASVSEPDTQPIIEALVSDSCHDPAQAQIHALQGAAAVPNISPTSVRRRSSGNRMSLSSRMRESFGGIMSGWDASRRPASSYNQTAPPSISHSRAATANNSGHSTKTHSRLPSTGDEAAELGQLGSGQTSTALDFSAGSTSLQNYPHTYSDQSPTAMEASRKTRPRQSSVCIGALGILEEMPERRSSEMDARDTHMCDIEETLSTVPTAFQVTAAPVITATEPEPELEPSQSDQSVSRTRDSTDAPGFADPFMLHRLVAGSGSRGHSRSGSLIKSIAPSSRGHSRRGSIVNAAAPKQRAPSLNSLTVDYTSASEQQQQGGGLAAGSRRESLGSNVSVHEGSIYNTGAGNVAEPLEVAVSARGSFSKPNYPLPPRNADTEDDDSIASQVSERLAKLGLGSGERSALHANRLAAEMLPMGSDRQLGHVLAPLEREIGNMLPPPRSIVDWSTTSADKVATWFLDNIPGNVSIINAPASAFGTPLAQQKKLLDSDAYSDCDCSSCDCSLYTSDSDGSSSSDSVANMPFATSTKMRAAGGCVQPTPGPPVGHIATGIGGATMPYSGITLPQPLGLSLVAKEPDEPHVVKTTEPDSNASGKQLATPDSPDEAANSPQENDDAGHKLHLGMLPASGLGASAEKHQKYLILSKPGGRFVPIDMLHGTMLPTVEPPHVPMLDLTGGNNAHLMNVDASRSVHSLHLSTSMGMSYPQYSGMDYTAMSSSYICQSPSWQSGSISWAQHVPGATYGSAGAMAKSPVVVPGPAPPRSQPNRQLLTDNVLAPSPGLSTEVVAVSQFPSSESLTHVAANSAPRARIESGSALPTASSRKSFASNGSASVFNSGTIGGPTSLSSNLRSKRSMQWVSSEGLRGQNYNSGSGPSPIYRGKYSTGAMTPELGGFGLGAGQHTRQNLGFAGLRGYIGNGIRQRASGNLTTNRRGDDGGLPTGYFTPITSGQISDHGLGQVGGGGVSSSGVMPREPMAIQSSSMSTGPSVSNAADRAGSARMESMRKLARGHRTSPSATATAPSMPAPPPQASASPQRGQHALRYSPSMAIWSSFKEGGGLSTIKDQDGANESAEQSRGPSRRNSATAASGGRFLSEPLPNAASSSSTTGPSVPLPTRDMAITPFSDEAAGRSYWMGTEPPSARSHSSLGTGASISHMLIDEVKEEEIEEAPQPMEMDVATYMVGGVAAGKRMRRILSGPTDRARVVRETGNDDNGAGGDSECEFELNELVSLVSMDGMMYVFDPVRKVNHFISLSSKDPVLGIWKVKMHEEVCNPSPLETMLQDGNINVNQEFGIQLLSSTPAKRIYRRIGLSHHDLLNAAYYSVFIEDRVMLVNHLEHQRRSVARRRMKKLRSQTRLNYDLAGGRPARRTELSPSASRNNTLSKAVRHGLNGMRLRENLKYQRVGRAVRNFGSHIRDFTTSNSAQQSAAESSTAGPYVTSNALTDEDHLDVQPSEFTTPGVSLSPAVRRLSGAPRVHVHPQQSGDRVVCSEDGTSDEAAPNISNGNSALAYGGVASSAERNPTNNMPTSPYLSARPDVRLAAKSLSTDIAAALTGWYGENRDDYRRALRVCDHLVVSTWRGTTYFVDVGTMLDIAHYSELFKHNWNVRKAAVNEAAEAPALTSEKDGYLDTQSTNLSTFYGQLSEFYDVTGLLSRLRSNGSVIQFKFQDTVSAFLADTYAPATGGPNVPCIFYVDYKDRIWAYYHLDEIAEMDDVYGATWFRDEPESLHTPASKARAIMSGIDTTSYDKPFSVADLAHRRINMEPWMPLPTEVAFSSLVSFSEPDYPYSTKTWRKRRTNKAEGQGGNDNSVPRTVANNVDDSRCYSFGGGRTFDSSDNSTPPFVKLENANTSGRYHSSYLPGPYLCPIWADIKSVDLYDVGVCNFIELATPELLVFKDIFCKDLGIDPSTINEKVNLASIPGLANWVRSCLFMP